MHTRDTVEKGTVLPGYGNPEPVPVPERTRDHIITGLPVPVSLLNRNGVEESRFDSRKISLIKFCPF